ncbi:META domain-containing protein [Pseudogemmobacter sonorensis]|uniref:META domain-containing protein n=1 Tax=Pseudogemmobacter sonorensis TaxID=2989681 RepID=UPI0036C4EBD0
MTRLSPAALIAALLTFALQVPGTAMADDRIASGEWQLLAIDGVPVRAEATFALEPEGRVSGRAACNRYFGTNGAELPRLSLGALGSTRMFCDDQAEEDAYLTALSAMEVAEIREGHLIMAGGDRVLEFVRDRGEKGLVCQTCD